MAGEKEPVPQQPTATDALTAKAAGKAGQLHEKKAATKEQIIPHKDEKKGPSGGFDSTHVPHLPPGYTVKITFHRATNLPIADINSMSSDPYILAELTHQLRTRHKQDPPIQLRTPTIRRTTSPEWNADWILCNIPVSGFKLKARLYDEDPADHDDRLGNVHIHVGSINENWKGIKEQSYDIKKRSGSKRAYLLQACTAFINRKQISGELVVSIQLLGRTQVDSGGKIFTLGPCAWSRHLSPVIGRMVGIKDPTDNKDGTKQQEQYKYISLPCTTSPN